MPKQKANPLADAPTPQTLEELLVEVRRHLEGLCAGTIPARIFHYTRNGHHFSVYLVTMEQSPKQDTHG